MAAQIGRQVQSRSADENKSDSSKRLYRVLASCSSQNLAKQGTLLSVIVVLGGGVCSSDLDSLLLKKVEVAHHSCPIETTNLLAQVPASEEHAIPAGSTGTIKVRIFQST